MELYEELRIENHDRNQEWHFNAHKRTTNGENIYVEYLVYCNCYGASRNDFNSFQAWLETTKHKLTFWQEKHLKEKYFGYKYTYDNENKTWGIEKL